jgi:uncharacterized repeat protein (TIGR03803 family)
MAFAAFRITIATLLLSGLPSASFAASSPVPVYEFPPTANGLARLGGAPSAGVTEDAGGNLFGTTVDGGNYDTNGYGGGVVYKVMPPAKGHTVWTEQVLHAFTGYADGIFPGRGNLVVSSGEVYGTTNGNASFGICGVNRNLSCDTIFKLSHPPAGKTEYTYSLLYRFAAPTKGFEPVGGLVLEKSGAFIGAAKAGGSNTNCQSSFSNQEGTRGCGTIYELIPPAKGKTAWTYSVLHFFTGGADGGLPAAAMLPDPSGSGAFFGTASTGGGINCSLGTANCGVVFKLAPPVGKSTKWTETVLYSFTGQTDGAVPFGALIADNSGNLYGTTSAAGDACQVITGCGSAFELIAPAKGKTAYRFKALHGFAGGADGSIPLAALTLGKGGELYGTTSRYGNTNVECGSAIGCGTIFKLNPPTKDIPVWTETVLYRFVSGRDGGASSASLHLSATSGLLYGTASQGGNTKCLLASFTVGCGVVFSLHQ